MNKIIQGDCLEKLKELADNSIDCVVTSPPYNKGYWNQVKNRRKQDAWNKAEIKYSNYGDNLKPQDYEKWQRDVLNELVRVIKPTGSIFYNHKPLIYKHTLIYPKWVFDYNVRQQIIWDRGNTPSIYPIRFYPTTEYIFWITKSAIQPRFFPQPNHKTEVWRITPKPSIHPAPFPEELAEQCILSTTEVGDMVLDPFAGSGTTCAMAKKNNRNYIGIEISPEYIEIINKRLE